MKTKNLVSMIDVSKEEMMQIFKLTDELKDKNLGKNGKTAALLFNRPSTRTHVSFDVALQQQGYNSIYLDYVFTQLIRGEKLKDTAKAISQYVNLIIARLVPHSMLEELAKYSDVPVINAGTDIEHPCQALGDLYTIKNLGKLNPGNKIVFIGDPADNVANSLCIASLKLGLRFSYVCPKGYYPNKKYLEEAKKIGNKNLEISNDLKSVKDADVLYTNAWAKDSTEEEAPARMRDFLSYQVNEKMLSELARNAVVMHPLPAFRGLEITDAVLDGKQSVVWQQTKNRLYVQKAVIKLLSETS